jgi:hypothetical protein
MIAVAFVAVFIAGMIFGERRYHCRFMASNHDSAEQHYRSLARSNPGKYEARIAHRARLKRKWERAALFPFWPVEPDPPDPP